MEKILSKMKTLLVVALISYGAVFAQTSDLTIAELEKAKATAITNENYQRASELKKLIEVKEKEIANGGGTSLAQLKEEKQKAIIAEDYALAAKIKEQIIAKEQVLNTKLNEALKNEDYALAAKIKEEIDGSTVQSIQSVNRSSSSIVSKSKPTPAENEKFLTFKRHSIFVYYGINNIAASAFNGIEGIEATSFVFDLVTLNPDRIISPAITAQVAYLDIAMGDVFGGFGADIGVDQTHLYIGAGVGVSTNFGFKNKESKFKPFALATLGLVRESVTNQTEANSYWDETVYEEDISVSIMGMHMNLKAGCNYMFSHRFGLTCAVGLNNNTNISVGLVF
jgi:hypothetical protein